MSWLSTRSDRDVDSHPVVQNVARRIVEEFLVPRGDLSAGEIESAVQRIAKLIQPDTRLGDWVDFPETVRDLSVWNPDLALEWIGDMRDRASRALGNYEVMANPTIRANATDAAHKPGEGIRR